jgi:hypothetical protein
MERTDGAQLPERWPRASTLSFPRSLERMVMRRGRAPMQKQHDGTHHPNYVGNIEDTCPQAPNAKVQEIRYAPIVEQAVY